MTFTETLVLLIACGTIGTILWLLFAGIRGGYRYYHDCKPKRMATRIDCKSKRMATRIDCKSKRMATRIDCKSLDDDRSSQRNFKRIMRS